MSLRMRLCESCSDEHHKVPAKYRCPCCDVASCSLACVRKHKQLTNCTGIRNRAAPVRKVEYTDTNLMSDYTLMEDTGRAIDAAVRTRLSTTPRVNGKSRTTRALAPGISKGRMNMLAKEAAKRNINLRFMPRGFARHARNSSYVRSIPEPEPPLPAGRPRDTREKAMFWHLDVYFASCNQKCPGTKLVKVDACEEEQLISSILEGATGALKRGRKRGRSDNITCSSKANDGYAKYVDACPEDLVVFLRNEHVVSAGSFGSPPFSARVVSRKDEFDINRYVPIEADQTLRQVLHGRSVVEFPVLHIAFKDSKEAKELAAATSGIFEKPDDSSDSGSSSESESEDDDDGVPDPARPDSPVRDPPETKSGKPNGTLPETSTPIQGGGMDSEREPLLKYRKIESSPGAPPTAEVVEKSSEVCRESVLPPEDKDCDTENAVAVHTDTSAIGGRAIVSSSNDAVAMRRSEPCKGVNGVHGKRELAGTETETAKDKSRRASESPDIGSSEPDSFVDNASRRGSGMHLDHPYMKESVKAILETRIPRKPKQDKGVSRPPSSEKRSASAKLAATG